MRERQYSSNGRNFNCIYTCTVTQENILTVQNALVRAVERLWFPVYEHNYRRAKASELVRFGQFRLWELKQVIQNVVWLYKLLKHLMRKYQFLVMETEGCM